MLPSRMLWIWVFHSLETCLVTSQKKFWFFNLDYLLVTLVISGKLVSSSRRKKLKLPLFLFLDKFTFLKTLLVSLVVPMKLFWTMIILVDLSCNTSNHLQCFLENRRASDIWRKWASLVLNRLNPNFCVYGKILLNKFNELMFLFITGLVIIVLQKVDLLVLAVLLAFVRSLQIVQYVNWLWLVLRTWPVLIITCSRFLSLKKLIHLLPRHPMNASVVEVNFHQVQGTSVLTVNNCFVASVTCTFMINYTIVLDV